MLHIHKIHTHSLVQLLLLFLSCLCQLLAVAFLVLHRIESKFACKQIAYLQHKQTSTYDTMRGQQ